MHDVNFFPCAGVIILRQPVFEMQAWRPVCSQSYMRQCWAVAIVPHKQGVIPFTTSARSFAKPGDYSHPQPLRRWQPEDAQKNLEQKFRKSNNPSEQLSPPQTPAFGYTASTEGQSTPISFAQVKPSPDPVTTRPAEVESPEPLDPKDYDGSIPITERAKHLYRIGRAYGRFYKIGFKNIWHNYKAMREIKKKLGPLSIYEGVFRSKPNSPNAISRHDLHLYLRTQHDLRKLLPFSLIFIVFGEWTPLIIMIFGSAVTPYTCRIPQQQAADLAKAIKKSSAFEREGDQLGYFSEVRDFNDWIVKRAYQSGLAWSPRIGRVPVAGPLLARYWYHPRLRQIDLQTTADVVATQREGGASSLSPTERLKLILNLQVHERINEMTHVLNAKEGSPEDRKLNEWTQMHLDQFTDGIKETSVEEMMDVDMTD